MRHSVGWFSNFRGHCVVHCSAKRKCHLRESKRRLPSLSKCLSSEESYGLTRVQAAATESHEKRYSQFTKKVFMLFFSISRCAKLRATAAREKSPITMHGRIARERAIHLLEAALVVTIETAVWGGMRLVVMKQSGLPDFTIASSEQKQEWTNSLLRVSKDVIRQFSQQWWCCVFAKGNNKCMFRHKCRSGGVEFSRRGTTKFRCQSIDRCRMIFWGKSQQLVWISKRINALVFKAD